MKNENWFSVEAKENNVVRAWLPKVSLNNIQAWLKIFKRYNLDVKSVKM